MTDAVDVVVVAYNSRDTLRACVEPLAGLPDVSVIVVDNASPDLSLEVIDDLPVRTIAAERNLGFAVASNLGLRAGRAPLVLFLNPDAQISALSLRRLRRVLETELEVAIVGPRVLADNGALVPSMRRHQRAASVWSNALFLHRVFPHATWSSEIVAPSALYGRPAYPEWLSGACLLTRRSVVEAVHGFDDGFFLYNEDMDLCARVTAAGHRVRYEPSAVAGHSGGRSAPRTSLYPVLARSRIRFARRHSGSVSAGLQSVGLATGALTHVLANARRPAHRRGHLEAFQEIVAPGRRPTSGLPRDR